MKPTPPDIHQLTGAYVLDALNPDEQDQFEQHLPTCTSCADEIRQLRTVTTQLALAVKLTPEPALRDTVLDLIKNTPRPAPTARLRGRRTFRTTSYLLAAAAVIAALTLTLIHTTTGSNNQAHTTTQQPNPTSTLLAAPDATTTPATATTIGGAAHLVFSRRQQQLLLYTTQFPVNDPNHSYQLWLLGDHTVTSPGLLHVTASGSQGTLVALPPDAHTLAITTEPAAGSPGPTTPIILKIAIT